MKALTTLLLAATCAVVVGCTTTLTKQDADADEKHRVAQKLIQFDEECKRTGSIAGTPEYWDCYVPQVSRLMDTYRPIPNETDRQKMARAGDLLRSLARESEPDPITRAIYDTCNRSFKPGSIEALDCVTTRVQRMFAYPRSSRTTVCGPAPGGVFVCTDD